MAATLLPFSLVGRVVRSEGRGGAALGFPTANVDPAAFAHLFAEDACAVTYNDGVYYGWARVVGRDSASQPMVMSVGRNPHFDASSGGGGPRPARTLEVHILQDYGSVPFYGALLCVHAIGYLRAMCAFDTVLALVAAIEADVSTARQRLGESEDETRREAEDKWQQQIRAALAGGGSIDRSRTKTVFRENATVF